ncbi:MAG: aminoacyl-tRNA hydrolase [Betaproteobacteria bacterium RIFCSPLOWO2_02_FULL_67_26]|nr:MAG: aminoacyl-tRNA hydrolase [Betaproteobacteria bacterium RIFCSPLOWO2_02_FULL_67_26]
MALKLIVGLGNPGDRYQATRHNAGSWLVERFAAETHTVLRKDAKFQALVGRHEASGAWLVLPQNFMNASGRPVQMLAGFFKIAPGDILVAHDELDFPPGVVRMKQGGGVAGHNGLKDVSARLGSHDYWRLRIGIGHPGDRNAVTEYVLHKPAQEERAEMDAAIGRALEVLPLVLAGDLQGAMLKLHSAPEPAPRPAKAEPPPASRTAAAPDKPKKAPKPAEAETPAQAGKPVKAGGLGAFLKKLLPDSDPARKK